MIAYIKTFSLILIILIMANSTWGLLAKSLTDNETIEEAINRLIAVHESDPTAHLGTGESLEAHKHDVILDHPAGSVLVDKGQYNQIVVSTCFEGTGGWTASAYINNFYLGFMTLVTNNTINNVADIYNDSVLSFCSADFDNNLMFQTTFQTDIDGNGDYILKIGIDDFGGHWNTMGVEIVDNVATGYFLDGVTEHTVSLGTLVRGKLYTLRIFANQSTGFVEFYFDGVLSGQIAYELHYTSDEVLLPEFKVTKKRGSNPAYMAFSNMIMSRDIPKPVTLIDSFDSATCDACFPLSTPDEANYAGMTFSVATLSRLDSCEFSVEVSSTPASRPTGDAVAYLYDITPQVLGEGGPTGSPLATSEPFDASSLPTSYAWQSFNFIGANRVILEVGHFYAIVLRNVAGDGFICLNSDESSPVSSHCHFASLDGIDWNLGYQDFASAFRVYARPI